MLDLSDVTFLDSAGIAALIDAAGAAIGTSGGHRPLRVVVDHARAVIRPIQISGLDELLQLFETRDGALQA